jgi:hypothetical protein
MSHEEFYDEKQKEIYDNILNSNVSRIGNLYEESRKMLLYAKEIHDELEQYYIRAMDFDALQDFGNAIIEDTKAYTNVKIADCSS